MKEHFVIDPLISKRQQLLLATQLCRMVLKVRFQYLRRFVTMVSKHTALSVLIATPCPLSLPIPSLPAACNRVCAFLPCLLLRNQRTVRGTGKRGGACTPCMVLHRLHATKWRLPFVQRLKFSSECGNIVGRWHPLAVTTLTCSAGQQCNHCRK